MLPDTAIGQNLGIQARPGEALEPHGPTPSSALELRAAGWLVQGPTAGSWQLVPKRGPAVSEFYKEQHIL